MKRPNRSLWLSLRLLYLNRQITPLERLLLQLVRNAPMTIVMMGVWELDRDPTPSRARKLLDDLATADKDDRAFFRDAHGHDLGVLLEAYRAIKLRHEMLRSLSKK
jgi:hypothetical protein